jgi:hypothetical protein
MSNKKKEHVTFDLVASKKLWRRKKASLKIQTREFDRGCATATRMKINQVADL